MATGLWLRGTEAARPAFGVPSRIYFAYDTGRLFSDTGTAWDPTGLAPQGAYSAGTTYQKNDLVTNGGQTWRAKQTVTGVTPVAGASWELWAAQGSTGSTGGTGAAGTDAYTTTTANFNQPAAAANVTINVGSSAWMFVGQYLYVAGGGYYTVTSKPSGTSVQINNINASGNASSGTTISSGAGVSPGGPQGIQGIQGPAGTGYTIQENGSALTTQRSNLNFGTNIVASDNSANTRTDIDVPDATNTVKGASTMSTATSNVAVATDDARVPTTGENDALVGTSGTPSTTNKYVTDGDARNTNARTPTAHAASHASGGSDPVSGTHRSLVTLGSPVSNSTTSFADVTGLSSTASANVTYRFEALVIFDAALATTGNRFSINGPASPTLLAYTVFHPTGTNSTNIWWLNTYDGVSTVTTSSAFTTDNLAILRGIIKPSAGGTVIVRFASEVAASALTVKAGSALEYW